MSTIMQITTGRTFQKEGIASGKKFKAEKTQAESRNIREVGILRLSQA